VVKSLSNLAKLIDNFDIKDRVRRNSNEHKKSGKKKFRDNFGPYSKDKSFQKWWHREK